MNARVIPMRQPAAAGGLRRASLLARVLGELMLAQVQHATRLHLDAARLLLRHARLPAPQRADQRAAERDDEWRMAWRGFEICATTADQIIGLTREQGRRSSAHLWRLSGTLLAELAQLPPAQLELVRRSFETLHEVQDACAHAAEQAQRALLAAVQAQLPAAAADESDLDVEAGAAADQAAARPTATPQERTHA
jgi:hypothetical protein